MVEPDSTNVAFSWTSIWKPPSTVLLIINVTPVNVSEPEMVRFPSVRVIVSPL